MSETQIEYETDADPTPGPWTVDATTEDGCEVINDPMGYTIALAVPDRPDPEVIENARLIAAVGTAVSKLPDEYDAIDVLEALPAIMDKLEMGLEAAKQAKALEEKHEPKLGVGARRHTKKRVYEIQKLLSDLLKDTTSK